MAPGTETDNGGILSMIKKSARFNWGICLLVLIASFTFYAASPAIVVLVYRMRHPGSQQREFGNFRFSTPFRWIAAGDSQVIVITRQPFWLFSPQIRGSIALDAVTHNRSSRFTPENFSDVVDRGFKRFGYLRSGERELSVAGERVLCLEGRPNPSLNTAISVYCFFTNSRYLASFDGEPQYASVFYNMLSGFSKAPSANHDGGVGPGGSPRLP